MSNIQTDKIVCPHCKNKVVLSYRINIPEVLIWESPNQEAKQK